MTLVHTTVSTPPSAVSGGAFAPPLATLIFVLALATFDPFGIFGTFLRLVGGRGPRGDEIVVTELGQRGLPKFNCPEDLRQ
jgi:hypothetical protein